MARTHYACFSYLQLTFSFWKYTKAHEHKNIIYSFLYSCDRIQKICEICDLIQNTWFPWPLIYVCRRLGVLKQRDRNFDNGKKKKKKERRNGKKKMGSLVHLTRCEKFLLCSRAGHCFPGCVYRSICPCLPFYVPQTFCLTQHTVPWPFAMSSEGTKARPKWLHLYQITKQGTGTGPHYWAAGAVLTVLAQTPPAWGCCSPWTVRALVWCGKTAWVCNISCRTKGGLLIHFTC